jgi:hypothetical protein
MLATQRREVHFRSHKAQILLTEYRRALEKRSERGVAV